MVLGGTLGGYKTHRLDFVGLGYESLWFIGDLLMGWWF